VSAGCNQLVNLKTEIHNNKFDIACYTETWLNNTVADSELETTGYHVFRRDRPTRGGGLLMYIKDDLISNVRPDLTNNLSNNFNEIMVCEIVDFQNNQEILVVLFYRPPNATFEFNDNIRKTLLNIRDGSSNKKPVLILGDLNMPNIEWDSLSSISVIEMAFCDLCDEFNLHQFNNNPSRDTSPNILDVVLCNYNNRITDVNICTPVLKSDHYQLTFLYHSRSVLRSTTNVNRTVYMYKEANYDVINYYLSKENLEEIILDNSQNLDLGWIRWKSAVLKIINKFIPQRVIKNKKSPPWIDGDVIHLANKKRSAHALAKRTQKQSDWSKYKKINNNLRNLIQFKHKNYINESFDEINIRPKRFWNLVSHKTKRNSVPHQVYLDNQTTSDSQEKANMFNQYFFSQFNSNTYQVPQLPTFVNNNLSTIILSEFEVLNVLKGLDVSKSFGNDGLSPVIYKNCANTLCSSLTLLYNLSIQTGTIPLDWKKADIIPIYKKGDKSNISNYRPISLLPVAGKILERCIHNHIYPITRPDIHPNQHGFMTSKSTTTQLLEFYDNIYNKLENKIQTDVLYLDLSKAFDSVSHELLLLKLKTFGFSNNLYNWFESYLDNRKQRVLIEGKCSSYKKVLSGVPQGSILGPLLFLYFINDMPKLSNNEESQLFLYADDSKLCNSVINIEDCHKLQDSLHNLLIWGNTWGMNFNESKCVVMSFSKCANPILYDYYMNNVLVKRVYQFVDLGLLVNNCLKWEDHINNIVSRANKRLGLIKRCLGNECNLEVKLNCYTSLVRPILEASSCVWSCNNKKQISKIESVQRRATKYILCDYTHDYKTRLESCHILPLTYRREYLDMVLLYNFLHNLVDVKLNIQMVSDQAINRLTRHSLDELSLVCNYNCSYLYKQQYCNRITFMWNNIPFEIRNCDLTDMGKNSTFKNNLKSWLNNVFNDKFVNNNICTWQTMCRCYNCLLV
jgi:hypothetical protein